MPKSSRTGSCIGDYRAETLRPVRISVPVFDKRLNVPVVRWMLGFISSDLTTCKVHIARFAICRLADSVARQQVSNESLILAQNQRWRRA